MTSFAHILLIIQKLDDFLAIFRKFPQGFAVFSETKKRRKTQYQAIIGLFGVKMEATFEKTRFLNFLKTLIFMSTDFFEDRSTLETEKSEKISTFFISKTEHASQWNTTKVDKKRTSFFRVLKTRFFVFFRHFQNVSFPYVSLNSTKSSKTRLILDHILLQFYKIQLKLNFIKKYLVKSASVSTKLQNNVPIFRKTDHE